MKKGSNKIDKEDLFLNINEIKSCRSEHKNNNERMVYFLLKNRPYLLDKHGNLRYARFPDDFFDQAIPAFFIRLRSNIEMHYFGFTLDENEDQN